MWGLSLGSSAAALLASCSFACPSPQSATSLGLPATALPQVLSAPAARLCPSYWSGSMFLLYLLGCQTSIQFNCLSILVVFLFLNCCFPSFGCATRHNMSTYTILSGSPPIVLVSSLINVSIFHSTWLDTLWTDLSDS